MCNIRLGHGKWQPQKIISDMQCDAFKKRAQLPIPSIGHCWSKWPKLGSALSSVRLTSKAANSASFQSQIEAIKTAR